MNRSSVDPRPESQPWHQFSRLEMRPDKHLVGRDGGASLKPDPISNASTGGNRQPESTTNVTRAVLVCFELVNTMSETGIAARSHSRN